MSDAFWANPEGGDENGNTKSLAELIEQYKDILPSYGVTGGNSGQLQASMDDLNRIIREVAARTNVIRQTLANIQNELAEYQSYRANVQK